METQSRLALIARLEAAIHDCLKDHVPAGEPLAILDFPDIRNCGDSAIWLGEMAYLAARHGKRPAYVSRLDDFSARQLERAMPSGPIFIHGGGNFGDIFAGYAAKRMGLPIERLVVATNDNDILARALASGEYRMKGVVATTSPSMDIQVSSNFERLLFEAAGRDAGTVRRYMDSLKQSGAFTIGAQDLARIRAEFDAGRATSEEAAGTIRRTYDACGYLLDPHTAAGVHVAAGRPSGAVPMVVLGTAHPAKFPAAVEAASGVHPALPEWLAPMMDAQEKFTVLPSDLKMVEDYVSRRSRAAR